MSRDPRSQRAAYSVVEMVAALGALMVAAVVVAQLGVQSLAERQRSVRRHAAIEAAANILESARAAPWELLTPEWAAGVGLPAALAERLSDPKLSVAVHPVPDRPGLKRVDVELAWQPDRGAAAKPVRMSALFARRAGGAQP